VGPVLLFGSKELTFALISNIRLASVWLGKRLAFTPNESLAKRVMMKITMRENKKKTD
jgi:hypothetical protein